MPLLRARELAYIAQHYIYTDHSQKWTASGGGALTLHDGLGKLQLRRHPLVQRGQAVVEHGAPDIVGGQRLLGRIQGVGGGA